MHVAWRILSLNEEQRILQQPVVYDKYQKKKTKEVIKTDRKNRNEEFRE